MLVEPAPAKVNLWLHVTGRRDDGYHCLDSLVAFTELGDRLSLEPDRPLSLSVTGPFADALAEPPGAGNLVLAAATAVAAQAGRAPTGAFSLEKRLPVAAGLGGGSADAAAAIRLLVRAWGLDPDDPALARLALTLGADVPVCLTPRTTRVDGIGERLAPAPPLTGSAIVLVNPRRPVSTAAVFRRRAGPFSAPPPGEVLPTHVASTTALAEALSGTRNDLEAPALVVEPVVSRVLDRLSGLPDCRLARMSGSGATCFALFADRPAADAAARRLAAAEPDWWVQATALL